MTTTKEPITEFGEFVNPTTEAEAQTVTMTIQLPTAILDKLVRLGAAKNESAQRYAAHVLLKHCSENIGKPFIDGPSRINAGAGKKITGPSDNYLNKQRGAV